MRKRNNKGITLIALVITIIVLLILAGVTISMVLGDDGIIAQAQQAKKAQENADEKDAIEVAKGEAAIAQYGTQKGLELTDSKMSGIKEKVDTYNTGKTEGEEGYYNYKNTVARITEDGVPIPVGFAYVEGTKKETGLIIVDGDGNEFVWVPVDGTNVKLELDDTYAGWIGKEPDNIEGDNEYIPGYNDTLFQTEYNAMTKSVSIYGGFYVGRYETSWTGSKVASVPNVTSMNNKTWYTFYNKQKELYENSSSVASGMIYGSQWDAIMDWMKNVDNPNVPGAKYITNSTGMGQYCYDDDWNLLPEYEESGVVPIKTGSNPNYAVNNIYDLAGNYAEWTQESCDSLSRVIRGSYYWDDTVSGCQASYRIDILPDYADDVYSSRLQLYIK